MNLLVLFLCFCFESFTIEEFGFGCLADQSLWGVQIVLAPGLLCCMLVEPGSVVALCCLQTWGWPCDGSLGPLCQTLAMAHYACVGHGGGTPQGRALRA